jgi:beta-lactamase regulating signal transducer with metallopeptidase domain
MITLLFSTLAFSALAVWMVRQAGRRDEARDPRLTGAALALVTLLPAMILWLPKAGTIPVPALEVAVPAGKSWWPWLAGLWAAGAALGLLRLALATLALARWQRCSVHVGSCGRIAIRAMAGLKSPVAAGVFRPVVFVPDTWHEWAEARRKMVMDHELTHHQRHDPLWRWCAELACALQWFNPAVWWMARRLTLQCEYACDAQVLSRGGNARAYASMLCDLAAGTDAGHSELPLALAMAERSTLEGRVRRLLTRRSSAGPASIAIWIAASVISAAALALLGSDASGHRTLFTPEEIETRWSADPFPGEP